MQLRIIPAILSAGLAIVGAAPSPAEEVRMLVPIFVRDPLPGSFGSSWITDSWIHNGGPDAVEVFGVAWTCFIPECGFIPATVVPGVSFRPRYLAEDQGSRGLFIYPNASGVADLQFLLRFRDLSRQDTSWGTDLPVVPQSEFRESAFSLLDVPASAGFRHILRIYDLDGVEREAFARVRVYRLDPDHGEPFDPPDTLLGEAVVRLEFTAPVGDTVYHPGYAMISDLSAIAPLGDAERLRIEIEPETPGLRLWAFVTIVHNETQHATVVTPQ